MANAVGAEPVPARPRPARRGRDRGFSLIEIMAGMAIIAILALAILPQFRKYFERAALQNLSQEVQHAAEIIESDHSLSGQAMYSSTGINASLATVKTNPQTTWSGILLDDTGTGHNGWGLASAGATGPGYLIAGYNPAVTHYNVWWCSNGSAPGLHVVSASTSWSC